MPVPAGAKEAIGGYVPLPVEISGCSRGYFEGSTITIAEILGTLQASRAHRHMVNPQSRAATVPVDPQFPRFYPP